MRGSRRPGVHWPIRDAVEGPEAGPGRRQPASSAPCAAGHMIDLWAAKRPVNPISRVMSGWVAKGRRLPVSSQLNQSERPHGRRRVALTGSSSPLQNDMDARILQQAPKHPSPSPCTGTLADWYALARRGGHAHACGGRAVSPLCECTSHRIPPMHPTSALVHKIINWLECDPR